MFEYVHWIKLAQDMIQLGFLNMLSRSVKGRIILINILAIVC
jgi:hypothetical protein